MKNEIVAKVFLLFLQYANHYAKRFMCLIAFNPHSNPTGRSHSQFTDGETEAEGG